jgi:large subunit ribosomal protein L24
MKLKKGDTIIVTTGKDKGRQAKIERVFLGEGKVLVPGLNQYKKHNKAQGQDKPGEIVTLSRPFITAKVALVCPKCKQQTRVGYKMLNDKKVRVCRKCDATIE